MLPLNINTVIMFMLCTIILMRQHKDNMKRDNRETKFIYIEAYRGEDCFNMKGERIKSQSLDQNRRFKFNC